jgi:hypothetical protein
MTRPRRRLLLLVLAVAAAATLPPRAAGRSAPAGITQPGWERALPAVVPDATLPPLPERSPRIASYSIAARLDPVAHSIDGRLELEWRNETGAPVSAFPFHLYWNAFRNTLSTSARGEGRRSARQRDSEEERSFGWTHVRRIALVGTDGAESDLTASLRYIQPDDGNTDDRTLMEVTAPEPLAPGATGRFRIEWSARIPYGSVGRAGWVHDYNFIVQWFPKIAGIWRGGFNAHQFHPTTEFFADFGVYDVSLTLPDGFTVGASGVLQEERSNPDGTRTLRYRAEDVHDFAWTASRRFLVREDRFVAPGYPEVAIRLLLQPEHAHLAERYLEATKIALRAYGAWSATYPYPSITVVDPAWNSASGGMEYPTLFTGGASIFAPPALQSPEGVTIHEAGHQFWYGLVANNEFLEAWLDEGFNSYHDIKSAFLALGPEGKGERYFGLRRGERVRGGIAYVAPGVFLGRGDGALDDLREHGERDRMARRAWEYVNGDSYSTNSYDKPALMLQTLEALVGDPTMTRILRTYARRYRFAHPRAEDFIATVNEVTGQDWQSFFDETLYSDARCDYAVEVRRRERPALAGFVDGPDGAPIPAGAAQAKAAPGSESEVLVRRLGGVRLPVELLVVLDDGRELHERWDGRERWRRFRYEGRVVRAVVDPGHELALDVVPANNAWIEDRGVAARAATKWALRYLIWLQNLLELHTVVG